MSKCPTCGRAIRKKKSPMEKAKSAAIARLKAPMPKQTVYKASHG